MPAAPTPTPSLRSRLLLATLCPICSAEVKDGRARGGCPSYILCRRAADWQLRPEPVLTHNCAEDECYVGLPEGQEYCDEHQVAHGAALDQPSPGIP